MADPFISRQDLTDHLGKDVTSDDGALIAVDAACDIVRDVAEQTFNRGTSTVVLDGTGTDALMLPELPVVSVSSVAASDSAGSWTTAGTADYSLNGDGVLFATNTAGTSSFGSTWAYGRQNYRVTYVHGYADADLPRSVRRVALEVASRLFLQGPKLFESFGDVNVRYAAESTALMPTERLVLAKYRKKHST